jgi:hypothetical protein
MGKLQSAENVDGVGDDLDRSLAIEVAPFPPHRHHRHFAIAVLGQEVLRGANQVGVESSAEALVPGDQDHQDLLHGPLGQQGMRALLGPRRQAPEKREHLVGVRPGVEDAVLRPPQPRRRHHLHRPGNLLGVLHRADAPSNVEYVRHDDPALKSCA